MNTRMVAVVIACGLVTSGCGGGFGMRAEANPWAEACTAAEEYLSATSNGARDTAAAELADIVKRNGRRDGDALVVIVGGTAKAAKEGDDDQVQAYVTANCGTEPVTATS
jgi:hypothetical protein